MWKNVTYHHVRALIIISMYYLLFVLFVTSRYYYFVGYYYRYVFACITYGKKISFRVKLFELLFDNISVQ